VQGTIKFFNIDRGYGFIKPESGPDVFVHISSFQAAGLREPHENDHVSFDVEPDTKSGRLRAANLVLVS
jgi:CspA family cold shock protein